MCVYYDLWFSESVDLCARRWAAAFPALSPPLPDDAKRWRRRWKPLRRPELETERGGKQDGGARRRYAGWKASSFAPGGGFKGRPGAARPLQKRTEKCPHQEAQRGKLGRRFRRAARRSFGFGLRRLAGAKSRATGRASAVRKGGRPLEFVCVCVCVFVRVLGKWLCYCGVFAE